MGIKIKNPDFEIEITSERLYHFLQNTTLPPHLSHFKTKTKREIAHLLAAHLKKKERKERITVFFF